MVKSNRNVFVTKDLLTDVSRVTRLGAIWGALGVVGLIATLVGISHYYQEPYGFVSSELYWILFVLESWMALGATMQFPSCLSQTKAMAGRDDVTLEDGERAEDSLGETRFSLGAFLLIGVILSGIQFLRVGFTEVHWGIYILVGFEVFALLTSYLLTTWGVWALESISLSTREELTLKGVEVPPRITWRDVKFPFC